MTIKAAAEVTKATKIVYAELETPNFFFQAFGHTRSEAIQLMHTAWKRHCRATGADPNYWTEDDLAILEVNVPDVYCDHDKA